MEWINIRVAMLRAPEYIGSDPVERATWFNVLAFCVEQENDGRIVGAASWKDRQWQQACGVTYEEVRQSPKLLIWEGDDLIVWNFPSEKQDEVKRKREAGRLGGLAKTEAKTDSAKQNGNLGGRPKPDNLSTTQAETQAADTENPSTNPTEGKGRGIGKEGEVEVEAHEAPLPPAVPFQDFDDAPHIPTVAEVIAAGVLGGIPADFCAHFHAKTTERNSWLARGQLSKWKLSLVRWWNEDRVNWKKRPGAGPVQSTMPSYQRDRIPDPDEFKTPRQLSIERRERERQEELTAEREGRAAAAAANDGEPF